MEIKFFCPRWGSENIPWKEFMDRVKCAGYDGIEWAIGATVQRKEICEVWNEAARQGLLIIAQHYDTCEPDYSKHFSAYSDWFSKLNGFPPLKINSQTGREFFSMEQNLGLINVAQCFAKKLGVEIVHETHRGKFSFAAHITYEYLLRHSSLHLTLDLSHWVCVSESYLEGQDQFLDLAFKSTHHLHARVGYPEGPQVSDPSVNEHNQALEKHLGWWDRVIREREKEGVGQFTITPEFGPHPYMVHHPVTNRPLANQWEINCWMLQLLKKRYQALVERTGNLV